ncbi:hypothetical protein COTS27_01187 [Spirochaetota bacterium]|nr:hypothetical protein COTS27_01187 [Spirochaetota bacterium]
MEQGTVKKIRIIKRLSEALSFKPNREVIKREVAKMKPIMEFPKVNQAVYIFHAEQKPLIMNEIGRLRENCWKFYGYSTGNTIDIDFYDTNPNSCYKQIFIWDTKSHEILGGCRYVSMVELREKLGFMPKYPEIHTFKLFSASEQFLTEFLPQTVELQRVFVIPRIGPDLLDNSLKHAPFVLDNIFKTLGQFIICKQNIAYVTGRATFPPSLFPEETTNKIIRLLHNNIARYDLLLPKEKFRASVKDVTIPSTAQSTVQSPTYKAPPTKSISLLQNEYDPNDIPIILKIYLNLSDKIYFVGGIIHPELSNSVEIAIIVSIKDFFKKKKERYLTGKFTDKTPSASTSTDD